MMCFKIKNFFAIINHRSGVTQIRMSSLLSLVLPMGSSSCSFREFFPATIATDLLIRHIYIYESI